MIVFAIILTALLVAVIYYDITRFIIPNWINLAIILIYPVFLIFTPVQVEWWWSAVVMLCFFGAGYAIFALGIMGGGDIKLLIALSIWLGPVFEAIAGLLFWTAISGGILAIFLLITRAVLKSTNTTNLPALLRPKEPIPYGLAIAYAFLYLMWDNKILGLLV